MKHYEVFGTFEAPISCTIECETDIDALSEAAELINNHKLDNCYIVADFGNGRVLKFRLKDFNLNWEMVIDKDEE